MARARFNSEAFYAALDGERQGRKLTWKKVASEAGVSPSTLTRIGQGKRPDVDSLAALCSWAGLDADEFIELPRSAKGTQAGPLAMISTHLRSDPNLSPKSAEAMEAVIKATYEQLREDQE